MAKITPVLWKHKQNDKGHSPIYLRIYAGGKTKYKSLSVYLHPRHWNERRRRVRKSHRQHGAINTLISKKVAEAEGAILDRKRAGKPILPRHIKRALETNTVEEVDFFAYADEVRERLHRQASVHTARNYGKVCRKLQAWCSGGTLPFSEITPQFLREYETYLIEKRGNARTTVHANFRVIRAIYYRAIRDGLVAQGSNPFFHFKLKEGTPDRDKLTHEQVRAIEELELKKGSLIWHVRNYFLFALYGAGIRFTDLATMQCKNIIRSSGEPQRLSYRMSKTEHPMDMRLVPPAREIVRYYLSTRKGGPEDWLFPILDGYDTSTEEKLVDAIGKQNALVNKYLKKVAAHAEIDVRLTSHVARHSFASIALRRGWDVAEISERLGHSGGLKVTQRYLKGFDGAQLDDKMDDLFGGK